VINVTEKLFGIDMILPTPAKHWLKTQYEQWALTLASAFITMKKIWYGSTWVCWAITINIGIPFPKPFKHVFNSREILQLVAPKMKKPSYGSWKHTFTHDDK